LAVAVGCGPQDNRIKIAVIPKCTSSEFWGTVEEGARAAAKDYDVNIHWDGTDTELMIPEQNRLIETMVNLRKDGIALAPLSRKATQSVVQRAAKAGIPVVVFDSAVDGDAHVSFVATDNERGGALAAEHMIELLGKSEGKIVVFRYVQGTASTESRAKGFIDTVKAAGLEVIADPYPDKGDIAGCKTTAETRLRKYVRDGKLDVDGIFCCNDRSSVGAAAALDDIRKQGMEVETRFIGFDFPKPLVDALQEGKIDAIIAQDPHRMGYLAVETLVKHLRNEEVPKFIDTGVKLVTKQRLDEDEELRKLVGAEEKK
jgi:ribose transport system substrate-binding protein